MTRDSEVHMTNRQRQAVAALLADDKTASRIGACSIASQGAEVLVRFAGETIVIDEMGREFAA